MAMMENSNIPRNITITVMGLLSAKSTIILFFRNYLKMCLMYYWQLPFVIMYLVDQTGSPLHLFRLCKVSTMHRSTLQCWQYLHCIAPTFERTHFVLL